MNKDKQTRTVSIPPGGLKPGIFINDLTQVMNSEDADLVRKEVPWFLRSGPGLLPVLLGPMILGAIPGTILDSFELIMAGVFVLGSISAVLIIWATQKGWYDKGALTAAEVAIARAKKKGAKRQD